MSLYYDHEFDAPVVNHDVGSQRYRYTVVFLPDEIKVSLPLKEFPRLRISGEVNDFPFEASLTPVRGNWYILLSKKTLKQANASLGDVVSVRFRVADQDEVDVPAALVTALTAAPEMQLLWRDQTPGKQRGLAYLVASAKRPATQRKRIALVFEILEGKRDMRGRTVD